MFKGLFLSSQCQKAKKKVKIKKRKGRIDDESRPSFQEMGCVCVHEAQGIVQPDGGNHRRDNAGGIGVGVDGQQQMDPILEHHQNLENRRPQELECYWTLGAMTHTDVPPNPTHRVPAGGPFTVYEKVPAVTHPKLVQRVVFCSQSSLPVGSEGSRSTIRQPNLIADDSSPPPPPTLLVSTKGAVMPHHVMTAPFPIPRSFVMEDLIAFHSTSAGGDEKEREKEREEGKEEAHAANNEMRFREEQNSRPLHCPLTAQVALPEDPLVARAFFPHSLFNYTVGWVKLPSGPVRNKRRPSAAFLIPDDDEEDDAPVAHIGMQGIVAAASAGPVTATTTTTMADPALEPKGFLCASKPVYDVTVDGPVTAPYDPRVEEAKYKQPIGAPCVVASLRHLEKYYLYVKRLTHICLTLSWKDPLDNEAPFVDVDRSYGISYLHGPAGGPKLQ